MRRSDAKIQWLRSAVRFRCPRDDDEEPASAAKRTPPSMAATASKTSLVVQGVDRARTVGRAQRALCYMDGWIDFIQGLGIGVTLLRCVSWAISRPVFTSTAAVLFRKASFSSSDQ